MPSRAISARIRFMAFPLERVRAGLAGTDAHDLFSAAIQLGVPLLPAEALYFCNRDSLNTNRRQGLADLVELERLDNCGYQFHWSPLDDCADLIRVCAPMSERLLDEDGAGRLPDVPAGNRVDRLVDVGVAPEGADIPAAAEGVSHAKLPVGVIEDAVRNAVLVAQIFLASNVSIERPLLVDRIVRGEVEVPGVVGNPEGVVDAVGILQRSPLP